MTNDLNISLVQTSLEWENPDSNRKLLREKIDPIEGADLIILPEMFTTGFSMNSKNNADRMNGPTHIWMKERAAKLNAAISGSIIIEEDGKHFNRMLFVFPDGTTHHYDKRHLFRMADETAHFSAGLNRVIVQYMGWKIFLQVCYDLRFPIFSRNRFENDSWEYDMLIYVANWPKPRINAWDDLLKARAHENQVYVVGVNRIGSDQAGKTYNGHSAIYSPKGETLLSFSDNEDAVKTTSVSMNSLDVLREKFPIGMDADSFNLT